MLKVYTLVDARRHLRRITVTTEKRATSLDSKTGRRDVTETHASMATLSELLQESQRDADDIEQILISLQSELWEEDNGYMTRLYKSTEACRVVIQEQIRSLESRLSALTTRFDSKLQVLLKDLERRFIKTHETRYLVRRMGDREIGILSLTKSNSARHAFCVVMTEPMTLDNSAITNTGTNLYKLFFNAIPPEIALENFSPFLSPSQAARDILSRLSEEGL